MDNLMQSGQLRFMRGKSRYLFWPFLAFLILAAIFQYLQTALVSTLARVLGNDGFTIVYGIQAAAFAIAYLGGMVGFLLAYGLKSTVKAHRTAFIVLAVFTLLPVAKGLLAAWNTLDIFTGANVLGDNLSRVLVSISSVVLPLVASVAWISCLSVIAAGSHCSAALRASAIVLALAHLYLILYSVAMPSLSSFFYMQYRTYETYSTINNALQILNGILQVATIAFFFAALSFGKQKQPKVTQANTLPV